MLKKKREVLELSKSVGFIAIPLELLSQLVCYLNNANTPRDKKIVGILEQLLTLERSDPKKIDGPLNALNRDLGRYVFRARVLPWLDADFKHATRWVVHWYSGRPGRKHVATFGALDMIFDLARAGHLKRLRRCDHCGNWLYASSRHQVYCSTKCQQKNYRETPAFRAHRREYMRVRYHQKF